MRCVPHTGLARNRPYDIVLTVPAVPYISCVCVLVSWVRAEVQADDTNWIMAVIAREKGGREMVVVLCDQACLEIWTKE